MKISTTSLMVAGALSVAGMAAPAMAAPMISFTENQFALPSYTTATVFQDFAGTPNTAFQPGNREAAAGLVLTQNRTVSVLGTSPYGSGSTNSYLDIVSGSYTVSFAQPVKFFSFVIGSVDAYNSVTLNYASGLPTILTGRQIIGDSVIGPLNSSTSGRVWYDMGNQPGITSVTFASAVSALEIDALAAAVPEPATWGMMILGMGLVGGALRTRRRSVRFAA